jgi:hypothetical protein
MSPVDSVHHGNQHGTRLNHSPQKNAERRMQVAGCGEGGPASLRTRAASTPNQAMAVASALSPASAHQCCVSEVH